MQLKRSIATSLAALALAALAAGPAAPDARANPYETFIDVDSEEDLYDLQATGQIDEDTLSELVEVLQSGVDLNRAGREELYSLPNLTYGEVDAILDYRSLAGWIHDPIDLVVNRILTQEKLEAVAAFLVITSQTRPLLAASGWVRGQTRWAVEDEGAPPAQLQARVATLRNLTVGFASTLSRNRLTDVEYNANRDRLMASAADDQLYVPKIYAQWETDRWGAIAGTYRIGFGQRLTFDNTSLYTPNGFYKDDQLLRDTDLVLRCRESAGDLEMSPCTGPEASIYESPDYKWRDGLLGVAAGLKNVQAGPGTFQSYAFASYQPRSIYQYEIYSPTTCGDPHEDLDVCGAPAVYNRRGDPDQDTTSWKFSTLSNLFTEMLAGGNIGYSPTRRSHIGVTGYGADVSWGPSGMELDFQEWSRLPYGGPFGAVGMDGSVGIGMFDIFGEVTRSFDSMPDGDGGGYGALLRSVTTFDKQNELEASVRYYDRGFKNPYARPIAAPDEFEGQRARDEMGVRLRYTARLARRLNLRATGDIWSPPSGESTDGQVDVRADLDLMPELGTGLWGRYVQCLVVAAPEEEEAMEDGSETGLCEGEKYQLTGRLRFTPTRRLNLVSQYQHEVFPELDRQDAAATLIATARPWDWLRARGRVRYLYEDITSDEVDLEESVWGYFDTALRVRARDWLRLRYDVVVRLDDRESTQERVPSPEHWLWLEYESRF